MAVHLKIDNERTYCGRELEQYINPIPGVGAFYWNGAHRISVTKKVAEADCVKCKNALAAERVDA